MTFGLADALVPAQPSLPTYRTAADVLEKKNGSGWRLAGWTVARTVLILPPFLLVGVPAKKAIMGALGASLLISFFTLIRIANAGPMSPLGAARSRRRRR